MKTRELVALIGGKRAGVVRQDLRGHLTFKYDAAWRDHANAVPLSLSMPLAAAEHGPKAIGAFLWGLLPDNELILERWGRNFHVSPRNAFALIAQVGEDCAGAVQFTTEDRVESLRDTGVPEVDWIDEENVAARLRALREDKAAWRIARDHGQFSLAGSQPKTALLFQDGRWGVPAGRTPTTHILKPPMQGLDGHVENEHLCLRLAREVGLPTAESEVRRFGDEVAIIVTRYDRIRTSDLAEAAAAEVSADSATTGAAAAHATADPSAPVRAVAAATRAEVLRALAATQPILRLHQEDVCQALGLLPTLKYQNEGGPSPSDIVDLIREHSAVPDEDVATFVDALAFNWLVAGTDAHAKNYSLLHGSGGSVRLAPLYDLGSALPYPDMDPRRIKLAMRIGSKYRVHDVGPRQWIELSEELELDTEHTIDRVAVMATTISASIPELRDSAVESGLDHPIVARLSDLLANRAMHCARRLAERPG